MSRRSSWRTAHSPQRIGLQGRVQHPRSNCFKVLRQQRMHQQLALNWQRYYWNWLATSVTSELG